MVENKNKFVAIPIPVSCREKEKGDYIHYILDKTAGKYAGYRFFCASRFVKTEKEAKPENNGKLCDYLIMPRDRFVKLIAKDKSIDINSGDFQKLMKAIINDNVKKINLEKKKPRYLKAYLPSELRAKLYKKTQSYILDDRYGKYDGFYVNLPVNLISADEDVRVNDYVIKADKFSKEASQTIKLKKGEETITMPCDEFIALCKEALITESALVKENKRKEKIVKDTIEILGGEIEEGIYKDEETNKKIVYIVDQNRYLIVEDDDLELNENFELVISDEAKNRLAQTALKKESDGKGIFYDTVEDAKIALYSDDSDFIAGLSEDESTE